MHGKCALGSAAKTSPWFLLCVSPIGASTGPTHWKHRKERGMEERKSAGSEDEKTQRKAR